MSKLFQLWSRFCALRFVVVGAWNTVFSYLVFVLLYRFWGGGWHDIWIQGVTAVLGITNAYVLHRLLTFKSHGVWWREYFRFYVVYGIQGAIQSLAFLALSTWLGFNGYVVQVVLTLLMTVVSYWAHRSYSFKGCYSET